MEEYSGVRGCDWSADAALSSDWLMMMMAGWRVLRGAGRGHQQVGLGGGRAEEAGLGAGGGGAGAPPRGRGPGGL